MMTIITSIIELLKFATLSVSAFVGIKSAAKKVKERKHETLKNKNIEYHQKIASVYPIIQQALNSYEQIDRVTIFRSHNGDGIPKIGKQSYTSCIQEVITSKTTSITERWQNIPNDELMIKCITTMMTIGHANLPTYEAKCPEGILTDFCKGNNIKSVLAVPIAYTETGFIFLNFCSASCNNMEEVDGILFEATSCAGRVKELL